MVIWIRRAFLSLRHNASNEKIVFKYYKHRRQYYWKKLGMERSAKYYEGKHIATYVERKSQPRREIVKHIAKMIFKEAEGPADRLLTIVESRI
jgi:hypothetical protein